MLRSPPGSTRLMIVPVGTPGRVRTARVTPAPARSRHRACPASSSPTQPASTAGTPSCARCTATFAPAPPPRVVIAAVRSEPGAGLPLSRATTSVQTPPTPTTGAVGTAGSAGECRELGRDLPGELGVAQHQPHVDLQAGPGAGLVQVPEDERGDVLAAGAGRVGRRERAGDDPVVQFGVQLLVHRQRI